MSACHVAGIEWNCLSAQSNLWIRKLRSGFDDSLSKMTRKKQEGGVYLLSIPATLELDMKCCERLHTNEVMHDTSSIWVMCAIVKFVNHPKRILKILISKKRNLYKYIIFINEHYSWFTCGLCLFQAKIEMKWPQQSVREKYIEFYQTWRFQILLRKSLRKRLLKDINVHQRKPLHACYTLLWAFATSCQKPDKGQTELMTFYSRPTHPTSLNWVFTSEETCDVFLQDLRNVCVTVQDAEERSFSHSHPFPFLLANSTMPPSGWYIPQASQASREILVKHTSREPISLQSGQRLIIQRKFSMFQVFRRFWKIPDCSLVWQHTPSPH